MKNIIRIIVLSIISNAMFAQSLKIYQGGNIPIEMPASEIDSIKFTTYPTCAGAPTVTDYDGNVYNTVSIGTQCWMQENLKVTHFNNGVPIPDGTGVGDNTWLTIPYMFNVHEDSNNTATYGKFYTQYAVEDSNNLCPTGWRAPSVFDWRVLEKYLDNTVDTTIAQGDSATALIGMTAYGISGKLKEAGITHWTSSDLGATDSTGFMALPAGYRASNSAIENLGSDANFWTISEYGFVSAGHCAWYFSLNSSNSNALMKIQNRSNGAAVRCIKN